jgi:hypothetical protein
MMHTSAASHAQPLQQPRTEAPQEQQLARVSTTTSATTPQGLLQQQQQQRLVPQRPGLQLQAAGLQQALVMMQLGGL